MATRHGNIIEELPINSPGHVREWLERFDQAVLIHDAVLSANTDPERNARKVALLLSVVGPEGYRLIKAYLAPDLPNTKTLAELKTCILTNLAPRPSAISEAYKLAKLVQEPNEVLTLYMSRIKQLAANCEYGAAYERIVKDKFICGVRNEKLRAHLINDATITTSALALSRALAREASDTAAHSMSSCNYVYNPKRNDDKFQRNNSSSSSKSYGSKDNRKASNTCTRCKLRGHEASTCKTKCNYCSKEGHIAKNCFAKKRKEKVKHVQDEGEDTSDSTSEDESCNRCTTRTDNEQPRALVWYVNMGPVIEPASTGHVRLTSRLTGELSSHESHGSHRELAHGVPTRETHVRESHVRESRVSESRVSESHVSEARVSESHVSESRTLVRCSHPVSSMQSHVITNDNDCNYYIYHVNNVSDSNRPILKVKVNDRYLDLELDTGSSVSCISRHNFDRLNLSGCVLNKCDRTLIVANGQVVSTLHKTSVTVKFRDMRRKLNLYVVGSEFPTLFGRDWIVAFFGDDWLSRLLAVDVHQVQSVGDDVRCKEFLESIQGCEIFRPELGDVKPYEGTLDLKEDYRPKFCSARKVPFAVKDLLGKELDRLEQEGTLVRVDHSEFASPVVPILKKNGSIRVCGDYKATVNPNLDTKVYPLPVLEDCFAEMKGGKLFSKMDIKAAYNNIHLREQDQKLTTINTHQGLYKWTRLPYGISSSSGIFQSIMDNVLTGLSGVVCRVDDILITGADTEEHIDRCNTVIQRLTDAGFRCGWEKSEFLKKKVIYLGYEVSKEGVRPCRDKVETLKKAPYPTSVGELVSFLGAAQYYARFIPQMSMIIEPLNRLRTSKDWVFEKEEKQCFDKLKELLSSDSVLTFYDPDAPLKLDCDASAYGVGAVLSHVDPDGRERPIEFISRTLSKAERNYSQIEKEALGIVWAVKRLHRYLYARPFELCTDHKPLELIFHPSKSIPEMGTSRIQRWALILTHYQYTIKFRPTGKHCNADVCSRYPLPETRDGTNVDELGTEEQVNTVFHLAVGDDKPLLDNQLIARYSKKDPDIAKAIYCSKEGWPEDVKRPKLAPDKAATLDESATRDKDRKRPNHAPEHVSDLDETSDFAAYAKRRTELTTELGCLLWGHGVLIPRGLRTDVLQLLHNTHMGMSAMKSLARNYVWWPRLDSEIESLVRQCDVCQLSQKQPNKAVPHPWRSAQEPWERIHIDFAGPYKNNMWLIVIDSYSKWIEVVNMRHNTKSANVIKKLRTLFARYGLPKILVSDNGPQLISEEFEDFCTKNGINHVPIPSYHPASNGQAESIVGKFKAAMNKMSMSEVDMGLNLANWLLSYHNTPHSVTGVEPAVRMLGRRIRSALSLVHPFSSSSGMAKREKSILEAEKTLRRFAVGDAVLYRDVLHKEWKRGVVLEVSDKQYVITTREGNNVTKHIDHVVKSTSVPTDKLGEPEAAACAGNERQNVPLVVEPMSTPVVEPESTIEPSTVARPKRIVNPPDRLEYDKLGGP
jgi:transposase InsO family protein